MSKRKQERDIMHISEHELQVLTADMEEMHRETLPKMHSAAERIVDLDRQFRSGLSKAGATPASRRGFLLGLGATAGGLALAACGSSSKSGSSATTTTAAGSSSSSDTSSSSGGGSSNGLTGDLAIAALAASLENLAVGTYQAGLNAATAGKLGAVPPAVATFATTAMSQHKDHAAAWNSILTKAGKPAITGVDITVRDAVVTPGFAKVKNVVDLANFALVLEDAAAATYFNGIANALSDSGAIAMAATIQPVEMQHSAILRFVLGQYPIPDSFAKSDGARGPDDKIG